MRNTVLLYNGITIAYANPDNNASISLMNLSAFLKDRGFNVKLLLDRYSDQEICALLDESLAVGFSVYTGNGIDRSLKMTKLIKRLRPEVKSVWGGYHPTLEPEQTIAHPDIDFVVRGQGEQTLFELLKHLQEHPDKPPSQILGLSHKIDGNAVHNPDRRSMDIDDLPLSDFSLYEHVFGKNSHTVCYLSSTGCAHNCRFCCSPFFHKQAGSRFQRASTAKIIKDIDKLLETLHPKRIYFYDDAFFLNKKLIAEFMDAYEQKQYSFQWMGYGRIDFFKSIDDQLLERMFKNHLVGICIGIESGSQRILDCINKKITLEDIRLVVNRLAPYRKRLELLDFSFVIGFPQETRDDILKTVDIRNYIKSILPNGTANIFILNPYSKTESMEDCIKAGYKKPERLEDWTDFEMHSFKPPWLSRDMQKLVTTISWAAFFDVASFAPKSAPLLKRIAYKMLQVDGRFRLRHKLCRFAPEFHLINDMFRRKLESLG